MKSHDIFKQIKKQAKVEERKDFEAKDQVWEKIESRLDEQKEKKRLAPWIPLSIASSVLILIGLSIWYFNNGATEKFNDETPIAVNRVQKNNSSSENSELNSDVIDTVDAAEETEVMDELESNSIAIQSNEAINKNVPPSPPPPMLIKMEKSALAPQTEMSSVKSKNFQTNNHGQKLPSGTSPSKTPAQVSRIGGRNERVILDKNAKPLSNENSQMLKGYVAGIQKNVNEANSVSNLQITGTNSISSKNQPLYVLDGIPVNSSALAKITPNQINQVKILKDASATALYGSQGKNGVIIFQTKNLSKNDKKRLEKEYLDSIKNISPTGISDTIQLDFKIEVSNESYEEYLENPFESPQEEPLSTFSIDVDNASYSNIRRFLNNGQTVPKDAVRIEEMINYFNYDYDQPKGNAPLAIHTEMSVAPWNPKHKLLKIGLQAKKIANDNLPPSNLVFLIDVSGSMSSPNKLPLLKSSMRLLIDNLRTEDKVSIVVYAGAAGLVLPPTDGDKKNTILSALDKLNAGGSTAGGAGIELAYRTAQQHFVKGGNNRIILATDGDFNVGASSNKAMEDLIEEKRKSGIFLTILGYGMGNYKDDKMEIIADKGNGNYAYIDNMQEANKFLIKEFGGTLFTVAKDVKVQIEFNPANVQAYRLIGYENRRLRPEDFKNDAIDAGEMGSGHTVTALYEIIPKGVESNYFVSPDNLKYSKTKNATTTFGSELGTVKFRYKKPDGIVSKELVEVIPNNAKPLAFASTDFKFATAVAWFGLKLRDSHLIPNKNSSDITELAKKGRGRDNEGYRAEFIRLVEMVK